MKTSTGGIPYIPMSPLAQSMAAFMRQYTIDKELLDAYRHLIYDQEEPIDVEAVLKAIHARFHKEQDHANR